MAPQTRRPTETYLNVERRLGEPLKDFVQRHRDDDRSWPWIARKIAERTGIQINSETLRARWFARLDTKADSAA